MVGELAREQFDDEGLLWLLGIFVRGQRVRRYTTDGAKRNEREAVSKPRRKLKYDTLFEYHKYIYHG